MEGARNRQARTADGRDGLMKAGAAGADYPAAVVGLGACAVEDSWKKMSCFQPIFARESALK